MAVIITRKEEAYKEVSKLELSTKGQHNLDLEITYDNEFRLALIETLPKRDVVGAWIERLIRATIKKVFQS